ncbi:delta(3,5)-Delta(2,4)-dienoyl-CoA isomerase, mitochondrial-like [Ictalurus punctatus]|uniref:Delta(3,5)-Delta(2,4)-dienoyl-CoA isomerase, mitochondrial-like n=1 Tax=Ictalurus punctatus TaxID=7998 RepID=A0A9F7QXE5_ICTPU|nr:delta(3,5)-Delta(2,4)-dienoyl-CoA isomerase, mitochondrial-like [Ictalurus punctatus]XP_053534800.1 delta(3,5)-Delta(2,4)-dienoyl-CoA isomerase, mitochondrial-like [Ictalurus punctatus]
MSTSGGPTPPFTTLSVTYSANHITPVELHRPEKHNAMNKAYWSEMIECFNQIAEDSECRVVSGAGKIFTAVYIGYRQRKLSESLRDRMERTR